MKVGDLIRWTGYDQDYDQDYNGCTIGICVFICDTHVYIRWVDGELDEYELDDWQCLDLEVISESKEVI